MNKETLQIVFIESTVALFIFLFVYTGVNKLFDYSAFRVVLSKSPLLSFASSFIAWFLPVIELIVSLMLLMPFTRKFGLLISTSLMATFTFYLAYMIFFTPNLPCSCGGILKNLNWTEHLILNIVLLAMAFTAWWLRNTNQRFIAINRNSRTPE